MQKLRDQLRSFTGVTVGDVHVQRSDDPISAVGELACITTTAGDGKIRGYRVDEQNARRSYNSSGVSCVYYDEIVRVYRGRSADGTIKEARLGEIDSSTITDKSFLWVLKTIVDDTNAQVAHGR